MKWTLLAWSVLSVQLFVYDPVAAATYRVEGQITGGILSHDPDMVLPAVEVPFPLPYTGIFDYQPQLSLATFEFTADASPLPPINVEVGENLFSSVVQEDAAGLVVDFDVMGNFFKRFDLNLNKSTGQGTWELAEGCLACDFSIHPPNATATITSFSLIPEPGALSLTMLGVAGVLANRRRFRRTPRSA